jgi:hypothetical protein
MVFSHMDVLRRALNSSSLLLVGIILLYGSQASFFTFGNQGRYLALASGFGCVLYAAFRRAGWDGIGRNLQFIFLSGFYFSVLLGLSYMRQHDIFYAQKLVFIGVSYMLLVAGYALAKTPTRDGNWTDSIAMILGGGCLTLILYRFLGYVKMISFGGTERGFDVSELNPVGAAYTNMVLFLVFIYMAVSTKRVVSKPLYVIVAGMAALVVITTGSRGAPLWGGVSICALCVVLWVHKLLRINTKTVLSILFMGLVGAPVVFYLFKSNYALSEKLDIVITRFELLFDVLVRGTGNDLSATGRMAFYEYYLSDPVRWLFVGEKYYSVYPHNQFLEIMVRFGLLGLPLLVFSLCVMGKSVFKACSRKYVMSLEWYLILLLFLFSYLQSMTSLSLEVNRTLWLGFGYLYGYQYRLKGFCGPTRDYAVQR